MSATSEPTVKPALRPRSILLAVLGGTLGFTSSHLPTCWYFPHAPPSLVGLIFLPLGDSILRNFSLGKYKLRHRIIWITTFTIFMLLFDLVPSHFARPGLFAKAVGIDPPPGVRNLIIRANYYDGWSSAIEFDADEATIQQLLKARPFKRDIDQEQSLLDPLYLSDRRAYWFSIGSIAAQMNYSEHELPPPMKSPQVYRWDPHRGSLAPEPEGVTLAWDAATHHAFLFSMW